MGVRKRGGSAKKVVKRKSGAAKRGLVVLHNIATGKIHSVKSADSELPEIDHSVRVPTGITGLDKLMGGGFRCGTINLIGGGAGSGKSILCMKYLVDGIENHGENGIYISFEEDTDKILSDFRSFGWDLDTKIKEKKLAILYYTPQQVEKVIDAGGGIVRDTIESIKAKRLVVDSLTAFTLLHETELARRRAMLSLFDNARKWGVTALMTSQQEQDPEVHYSNVLEFETDAVILLYYSRDGKGRKRSIEIFKMRGSAHSTFTYPIRITDEGVIVESRPLR